MLPVACAESGVFKCMHLHNIVVCAESGVFKCLHLYIQAVQDKSSHTEILIVAR